MGVFITHGAISLAETEATKPGEPTNATEWAAVAAAKKAQRAAID